MSILKKKGETKTHFANRIVCTIIVMNILFVIASFYVAYASQITLDTLTISWFAFTGTELVALAGIRVTKNKSIKSPNNARNKQQQGDFSIDDDIDENAGDSNEEN